MRGRKRERRRRRRRRRSEEGSRYARILTGDLQNVREELVEILGGRAQLLCGLCISPKKKIFQYQYPITNP